ncbi:hypothetical protein IH981_01225, partial [Patescibacteria group bacterium]|nr:hypothetical protein [Patescibacteria group bacterium]
MRGIFRVLIVALVAVIGIGTLQLGSAAAHPLSGAIFTTLPDGSAVNENVGYTDKCQVALNGGPQGLSAHHLPDGIYDVGVTDPSGKVELGKGLNAVVIANGIGTFGPTSLCVLVDDPSSYRTTPNNGGVYKVWLCVSGQLFVHHDCKTDNFKVKEVEKPPVVIEPTPTPPPTALVPPAEEAPTPKLPTRLPVSGGEP